MPNAYCFSTTLHHEVDLVQLSEQIVVVVQGTVQPSSVSLWLLKSEYQELAHQDGSAEEAIL